jgi:hypothetical protein
MKITKEIIDWQAIRNILEEKCGKKYPISYLQSVRSGFHKNKKIEEIFIEIGLKK